jgi:putative transposase
VSAPYTQLFVHVVWATLDRKPLVTAEVEAHIHGAIQSGCHQLAVVVMAVGSTVDHVHLLARMPPRLSVAELAEAVKAGSASLMANQVRPGWLFEWHPGYGAFSLGPENVIRAIQYVRNQKALHAAGTVWEAWERWQAPEAGK